MKKTVHLEHTKGGYCGTVSNLGSRQLEVECSSPGVRSISRMDTAFEAATVCCDSSFSNPTMSQMEAYMGNVMV